MANYRVTYSCGHTATKQLYGPEESRRRYIAWAADSGLCADCYKADAAAALDALEVESALPALTGSQKQIAWARKIRGEKIADIRKWLDELHAAAERKGAAEQFEPQAATVMRLMADKVDSRYWIDSRDVPGVAMAQDALRASLQAAPAPR